MIPCSHQELVEGLIRFLGDPSFNNHRDYADWDVPPAHWVEMDMRVERLRAWLSTRKLPERMWATVNWMSFRDPFRTRIRLITGRYPSG